MKPLMLNGHERAITQIKYNREGDLLFSCAKDHTPNVWYALNGERLGTFNGHVGAVWTLDVDWKTEHFMSGGADQTLRIWDCATGVEIGQITTKSSVRTCGYSYSGSMAVYSTDKAMRQECEICVVDVRNVDSSISEASPIIRIPVTDTKVTSILWGSLDETIITGHDDGTIKLWDFRSGKELSKVKEHSKTVNDMQMNKDSSMFITASKDNTARLFDAAELIPLKVFKTERPVNSAAISPIMDHVVLGGGQEAMEVTTTSTRVGKFDSRFFHLVFEEEFGRVKGHFGPINSVAFHPDGKSYSSGGEDGYVRIHTFDQSYYEFNFDY